MGQPGELWVSVEGVGLDHVQGLYGLLGTLLCDGRCPLLHAPPAPRCGMAPRAPATGAHQAAFPAQSRCHHKQCERWWRQDLGMCIPADGAGCCSAPGPEWSAVYTRICAAEPQRSCRHACPAEPPQQARRQHMAAEAAAAAAALKAARLQGNHCCLAVCHLTQARQ